MGLGVIVEVGVDVEIGVGVDVIVGDGVIVELNILPGPQEGRRRASTSRSQKYFLSMNLL